MISATNLLLLFLGTCASNFLIVDFGSEKVTLWTVLSDILLRNFYYVTMIALFGFWINKKAPQSQPLRYLVLLGFEDGVADNKDHHGSNGQDHV